MPPTKKEQMAFMAMMDNFLHSSLTCNCDDCKNSNKKSTNKKTNDYKEHQLPKNLPSLAEISQHICVDHKMSFPPGRIRSPSAKEKRKPPESPTISTSQTRNDKINNLLKAESVHSVLEVFKSTPGTEPEKLLTQEIQNVAADGKSYTESKAKILDLCSKKGTDLTAVFGLLAKFRQERNLLSSAIIKSNSEREKSLLLVQRVNQLMYELQNVATDGKSSSGAEVRGSLSEIIMEIHDLATKPSMLYDELLELRDEHFDLLQDHEDEHQKFLDVEACHEKLHEKNKKLMEEHGQTVRELSEMKKKASVANGLKNDVTRLEKLIDKHNDEKVELKKEIEKLNAEMGKVNALKHENTQLKKKVTAIEVNKEESKVETTVSEVVQSKKKKGKKGTSIPVTTPEPQIDSSIESNTTNELNTLKSIHDEVLQELDVAKANLRKFEVLLKRAEVARDRALEKKQLEQATAQDWKELSEGHAEETIRLKEQLDQSITQATTLQNTVHQLEQSLTECREQLQMKQHKRPISPESQTSSISKLETEIIRLIRKIRHITRQLGQDLDESISYSGDPWNIISYTRKIVGEIEQELDEGMGQRKENDHQILDEGSNYFHGRQSIIPPGFNTVDQLPNYRPMLPPGYSSIGDQAFAGGRNFSNPLPSLHSNTSLPAPIGAGRPGMNRGLNSTGNKTDSPSPVPVSISMGSNQSSTPILGSGIGNGAAGVDWNMWARSTR